MKCKIDHSIGIAILLILVVSMAEVWAGQLETRDISGEYTRDTENESGKIQVQSLPDGMVQVKGVSFWGINRKDGPNIGELEFKAPVKNDRVVYSEKVGKKGWYRLELTFKEGSLLAR